MDYKNFYQQIGNLLYAMSATDGHVRPEELTKIKGLVKQALVPLEDTEDEFGTDAAYFTEFQLDFCCENGLDAKDTYADFASFFREHSNSIKEDKRQLIFKMAAEVGASFNGFNKSELLFLERLKNDLSFDKVAKDS
jgi:DNA-binding ferritin-like protein (Dps family)